jgi:uncharacterized membrane protein YbhN (UPF0104 family)
MGAGVFLLYRRLGDRLPVVRQARRLLPGVLSSFREVPPRVWVGTLSIATAARLSSMIAVLYLFQTVGISLPLSTVFLITSLYVFLPYLPITPPAGIGITEGFLLAFFVRSGMDVSVAAAASVQIHFLQLLIAAVLGALGLAQLHYLRKRDRGESGSRAGQRGLP